ncbi:unnamed protein product [Meganyctiphanes norvegica]|uniref:Uncharacterized protein n=1 Tax=Meganyctiphanes norvegica TaxID=48144 RepID=A0AAV2RZT2_MEGNR
MGGEGEQMFQQRNPLHARKEVNHELNAPAEFTDISYADLGFIINPKDKTYPLHNAALNNNNNIYTNNNINNNSNNTINNRNNNCKSNTSMNGSARNGSIVSKSGIKRVNKIDEESLAPDTDSIIIEDDSNISFKDVPILETDCDDMSTSMSIMTISSGKRGSLKNTPRLRSPALLRGYRAPSLPNLRHGRLLLADLPGQCSLDNDNNENDMRIEEIST